MKVVNEKRRVIITLDSGATFRIMKGSNDSILVYSEDEDHGSLAVVGIATNVVEMRCVNTDSMIAPVMMAYDRAAVFYLEESGDESFDEDSDLFNEIEMQISEGLKPSLFDIVRDDKGNITHVSKKYMNRLIGVKRRK